MLDTRRWTAADLEARANVTAADINSLASGARTSTEVIAKIELAIGERLWPAPADLRSVRNPPA